MSDLNLKSPRSGKEFRAYWDRFIGDIKDRPNLKPSHLWQLQVLCDLCVEYEELRDIINLGGRAYDNGGGRNGSQLKISPYVIQQNRVIAEIRSYCKMLDLVPYEDDKTNEEAEENEFE